jgi:hypothetical protein
MWVRPGVDPHPNPLPGERGKGKKRGYFIEAVAWPPCL